MNLKRWLNMSRNKIIANLRFVRRECVFHKTNSNSYPLKRALIEYFAKECLKYRDMLKATV